MATKRVKWRGRSIVALGLLGFLLVMTGVIWRRSYGLGQSGRIAELDRQRAQLESQKAKLQSDIRDASSRARLGPIAERRLNMHVPSDSQVIILPHPPSGHAPR